MKAGFLSRDECTSTGRHRFEVAAMSVGGVSVSSEWRFDTERGQAMDVVLQCRNEGRETASIPPLMACVV
jgi:hypothetical protein